MPHFYLTQVEVRFEIGGLSSLKNALGISTRDSGTWLSGNSLGARMVAFLWSTCPLPPQQQYDRSRRITIANPAKLNVTLPPYFG